METFLRRMELKIGGVSNTYRIFHIKKSTCAILVFQNLWWFSERCFCRILQFHCGANPTSGFRQKSLEVFINARNGKMRSVLRQKKKTGTKNIIFFVEKFDFENFRKNIFLEKIFFEDFDFREF